MSGSMAPVSSVGPGPVDKQLLLSRLFFFQSEIPGGHHFAGSAGVRGCRKLCV